MRLDGRFHINPDFISWCFRVLRDGDVESDSGCCSIKGWLERYMHIMNSMCSTSSPHGIVEAVGSLLNNTEVLKPVSVSRDMSCL